jgi:hypothetical protein
MARCVRSLARLSSGDRIEEQRVRSRRRHDRLLARFTFWERWRGALTVAALAAGSAIGYLLGLLARKTLHLPPRTEFYVAVITVVVVGRALSSFFDPRRLEVARREVDRLERQGARRP